MKQTGKNFLLSAVLVLFTFTITTLQAQPSFIFPSLTVDQGSEFNIDLKVADFEDIISMQFTMEWDVSVLKFVGVENFGLTDLDINDFGTAEVNTSQGKLTVAWSPDNPVVGVTVLDSATIFTITFEAVGTAGSTTPLQFTDEPTLREVADETLLPLENVEYIEGLINIDGTNQTTTILGNADAITVKEAFPNPFSNQTQFQFELKELTQTKIRIVSADGKEIWTEEQVYNSGKQTLVLEKTIFPSTGTYYLQLIAPEFVVNQKLVFK